MSPSRVVIFAGPSLGTYPLPETVEVRPPAKLGDLRIGRFGPETVVVLIDGCFLHNPAPTHRELMHVLGTGCTLIGAASMGALRAAELSQYGMLGVGVIYNAICSDLLTDDAEVAVSMCPKTFRALTVPLVNVRTLLGLVRKRGDVRAKSLSQALEAARSIYFMERTRSRLLTTWKHDCPEVFEAIGTSLMDGVPDVKAADTNLAISRAMTLTGIRHPLPHSSSGHVRVEDLFWGL